MHRRVADYIQQNTYLTPSGIWSVPSLLHTLEVMGADRIMFSTDYPFQYAPYGRGRAFLEEAPLSRTDKEKIGHLNAEKVLKLSL